MKRTELRDIIREVLQEKKNALERYKSQKDDVNPQMQEPILTRNGLYIWELWTFRGDKISTISYYAEDKDGGNIRRISSKDFINLVKK